MSISSSAAYSFPQVGDQVPDFTLADETGKTFRLSQFKGSYVFLNFWATWCPPCVEEFPSIMGLSEHFKTKNLVVIAVSVDDSWGLVKNFLDSLPQRPRFLILRDPDKKVTTEEYGTTKFPETYWISPEGKLIKKFVGAFPWMNPKYLNQFESVFLKKTK